MAGFADQSGNLLELLVASYCCPFFVMVIDSDLTVTDSPVGDRVQIHSTRFFPHKI